MRIGHVNIMTVFAPIIIIVAGFGAGCSSAAKKEDDANAQAQIAELRVGMTAMQSRLENLDTKVSTLNDKQDSARVNLEAVIAQQKPKTTSVVAHPANMTGSGGGSDLDAGTAAFTPGDPEAGFVNDDATGSFRQARVLFQSKKYPEAVLAFSAFLDKFADHPLAGSAQFHIGESYFRQNEYQLAVQEFQRVLISYDRSSHVPETLKQIASAEDQLKKTEDAAKHRQTLMSLFPQSPSAREASAQEARQIVKDGKTHPEVKTATPGPEHAPGQIHETPATAPAE